VNLPSVHAFLSTLDLQRLKRDPESARFPAAESHLGIWKLIIPVAIVVLAVTGYIYLHRTPKLSDKDTAVLWSVSWNTAFRSRRSAWNGKYGSRTRTGSEWQSSSG
jgi:hypothetical protein